MTKNEKQPELADVFRIYGKEYRQHNVVNSDQFTMFNCRKQIPYTFRDQPSDIASGGWCISVWR